MKLGFYPWDWDDEEIKKAELNKKQAEKVFNDVTCWHQWIVYTGLNQVDEYCKLCGEKRPKL